MSVNDVALAGVVPAASHGAEQLWDGERSTRKPSSVEELSLQVSSTVLPTALALVPDGAGGGGGAVIAHAVLENVEKDLFLFPSAVNARALKHRVTEYPPSMKEALVILAPVCPYNEKLPSTTFEA